MAEEVEATVIEDDGLDVTFRPAAITADFERLNAKVDKVLADYEGCVIDIDDKEQVKQAKASRTYLNGLANQITERRRAVKREYEIPLQEFEANVNAVVDKIKKVSDEIKEQLDEAERRYKDEKEQRLREHYEEFAELLAPVVPYEKLHEKKWLNKSTSYKKAEAELEAKVDSVAKDWESLKKLDLEFYDAAEAVFFDTLDLGRAVAYNSKLVDDRARIEEMKSQMQPVEAPEEAPVEEPEPAPAPLAPEPLTPEPVKPPEPMASDPAMPVVMVIDSATTEQIRSIGRFCGSIGVTGVFKRGTLQQVFERTFYGR